MSLPQPYYQRGDVTIYHADCLTILPHLTGVDAVVTDPPYGISYCRGAGGKGKHNKRNDAPIAGDSMPFDPSVLLEFSSVVMWGADHYAQSLPHGRWLAWNKLGAMESYDDFSDVEFAWHNRRGAARILNLMWKGICQDKAGEGNGERWHPTQKPIRLMEWCISEAGTTEGDTVLDPFLGSGTTAVACIRTGRRCIGIELEEKYCEIAAKRCDRELDQGRLFVEKPVKETQGVLV